MSRPPTTTTSDVISAQTLTTQSDGSNNILRSSELTNTFDVITAPNNEDTPHNSTMTTRESKHECTLRQADPDEASENKTSNFSEIANLPPPPDELYDETEDEQQEAAYDVTTTHYASYTTDAGNDVMMLSSTSLANPNELPAIGVTITTASSNIDTETNTFRPKAENDADAQATSDADAQATSDADAQAASDADAQATNVVDAQATNNTDAHVVIQKAYSINYEEGFC